MSYAMAKFSKYAVNAFSKLSVVWGTRRTYKSAISLSNLYPQSSLKLTTPSFIPPSEDKFSGYIPINKMIIKETCASGPGGQHVNKTNSKVDVRFKLSEADWLLPTIREKLAKEHHTKITKDGYLVMKSQVTRDKQLNIADCLRKLRAMIRKASEPEPQPTEETIERLRKRHEKATRDRLRLKRENSQLQNLRTISASDM